MTVALAGTLGVGNIVGVAGAITVGGAGAIFWMWISALAAMILKYAEVVLAIRHQRRAPNGECYGGAIYYIRDAFLARGRRRWGSALSAVFAALMILDALSMGCMLQVNAVSEAFGSVFGVPRWFCGFVLVLLWLPAMLRGRRDSAALTEVLIPLLTLGYVILTVMVILKRPAACGEAFTSIFREAFHPRSAAGGVVGFLTSRALRVGTMRGLLSNEAGCGTSPTAHASANAKSAAEQGIFGIAEVFVDTILLCTATALVILCSFPSGTVWEGNPVMLCVRAYSTVLGGWSEIFFCIAILCFGYGTLLCWSGYGGSCVRALSPRFGFRVLYYGAVIASVLLGAVYAPGAVWDVADFAIAGLTVINLGVLWMLRGEVREETRYLTAFSLYKEDKRRKKNEKK
jgi:AGCS family alanine or glycine:cation symporter